MQNVFCGIKIPLHLCSTLWATKNGEGQGKFAKMCTACRANLRARIIAIYSHDTLSLHDSFTLQLLQKGGVLIIFYFRGKARILTLHTHKIQIFGSNEVVILQETLRLLVLPITTLILSMSVQLGQFGAQGTPAPAAGVRTGQGLL